MGFFLAVVLAVLAASRSSSRSPCGRGSPSSPCLPGGLVRELSRLGIDAVRGGLFLRIGLGLPSRSPSRAARRVRRWRSWCRRSRQPARHPSSPSSIWWCYRPSSGWRDWPGSAVRAGLLIGATYAPLAVWFGQRRAARRRRGRAGMRIGFDMGVLLGGFATASCYGTPRGTGCPGSPGGAPLHVRLLLQLAAATASGNHGKICFDSTCPDSTSASRTE